MSIHTDTTAHTSGRSLTLQEAWRGNAPLPVAEGSKLKVFSTTNFEWVSSATTQVLGGAGYLRGNRVETVYREVKVIAIGGGSEEIMRDLAARQMGV